MLADGSTIVSISSRNGRCGGCAMVSRSPVATYCPAGKRRAVELQRGQLELLAVEHERRGAALVGIGLQRQRRADPRRGRVERDVEFDRLHQPVGRAIIGKADGAGFLGAHFSLGLGEGGEGRFYSYTRNSPPALIASQAACTHCMGATNKFGRNMMMKRRSFLACRSGARSRRFSRPHRRRRRTIRPSGSRSSCRSAPAA